MKKRFNFSMIISLFLVLLSCNIMNNNKLIELNEKGLKHLNNGDFDKAKSSFREAIAILSQSKNNNDYGKIIYRNAAITYASSNMNDSAKILYMLAYKCSPKNSYEQYINLADVYIFDQKFKESFDLFNKAYKMDSTRLEANNSLGLMLIGEYDMIHFMPESALKHNLKVDELMGDKHSKFVLGKNYYYLKEYQKSKEIINALHQQYPNDIRYLESLINIASETNNTADETELMNKLKVLNPELYKVYQTETIEE